MRFIQASSRSVLVLEALLVVTLELSGNSVEVIARSHRHNAWHHAEIWDRHAIGRVGEEVGKLAQQATLLHQGYIRRAMPFPISLMTFAPIAKLPIDSGQSNFSVVLRPLGCIAVSTASWSTSGCESPFFGW